MSPVIRIDDRQSSTIDGRVTLDWPKLTWNIIMIGGSLLAPFFVSLSSVFLFLALSYVTLLLGHSVGMHRMMIHRSFETPPWLRKFLIFLGTLVGMGGPSRIISVHDIRDWAQRQPHCHDYFSHRRHFLQDLSWQLFCKFKFDTPPKVLIEDRLAKDPFIQFLDQSWFGLQALLAVLLFVIGGVDWVIWGVCLRVFVSVAGHWTVTYICHNPGPGRWDVIDAGVQASDIPGYVAGLLTHGECWHSNHHAFPESACIGLEKGQIDPAWAVIKTLKTFGLAWSVGQPRQETERDDLRQRSPSSCL